MWYLEGFSRETEWLVADILVPDLDEDRARRILERPDDEAIEGGYPVSGAMLQVIATRAGYRPDPDLDYFLIERQD